jgi:hypothetical protein
VHSRLPIPQLEIYKPFDTIAQTPTQFLDGQCVQLHRRCFVLEFPLEALAPRILVLYLLRRQPENLDVFGMNRKADHSEFLPAG